MTEQVVKSNATYIVDIRYALPLYGYIMPIFVVITMVANTLIILVLSKKHMRTPTNTVLMAMALCDMLTLVFPAPWFCYLYTFGNYRKPLHHLAACYAYRFMHEIIPQYFHTASIWLTLALAVQRYIYVCHPPLARTWCTMERSVHFHFQIPLNQIKLELSHGANVKCKNKPSSCLGVTRLAIWYLNFSNYSTLSGRCQGHHRCV